MAKFCIPFCIDFLISPIKLILNKMHKFHVKIEAKNRISIDFKEFNFYLIKISTSLTIQNGPKA